MRDRLNTHPYQLRLEATAVSAGAFVVGCLYDQPEVAIPGLAIAGIGIIKLLIDRADFVDTLNNLTEEAIQLNSDC